MTRIEGDSVDGHRKETVSISFLTVHEVDPDEFDLRVKKPEKIREQLVQAADSCGWIQKPIETTDEALERYRQKIEDARSCGDRSVGAYRRTR